MANTKTTESTRPETLWLAERLASFAGVATGAVYTIEAARVQTATDAVLASSGQAHLSVGGRA